MAAMHRCGRRFLRVALLASGSWCCSWPQPGATAGPGRLPFSKGYLVTGNYVVGGVDLDPQVWWRARLAELQPRWQWLQNRHDPNAWRAGQRRHPRSFSLLGNDLHEYLSSRRRKVPGFPAHGGQSQLDGPVPATASCWSAGGGAGPVSTLNMFRADVLRLLPLQKDENGNRLESGWSTTRTCSATDSQCTP